MTDIELELNSSIRFELLIQQLVDLKYTRVSMVLEKGQFSVRGDIIDVFTAISQQPFRLEFELNSLYRMTVFSVHNQRTIQTLDAIKIPLYSGEHCVVSMLTQERYVEKQVISDLFVDDFVVHELYGIGQFKGVEYKDFDTYQGEYIILQYLNDDKVYVPVDQLTRIHKYTQTDRVPKCHSLSDKKWVSQKKRTSADIARLTEQLFRMYTTRNKQKGFAFEPDTETQLLVEHAFEHPLTSDQALCLREIKSDMESVRPMERLLCGDVGYGKTELLVRAALKALESNKQVAVLVPTTILADQHFLTFSNRLEQTKYEIKCLSRFTTSSEEKSIINDLKTGQCRCVIGTHRLLSKDVSFDDLGLLLVDEEQRFGVKDKERLKMVKKNVDILYVSATPIPRTLYMSLSGSKEMSLIQTPPVHRKPIITYVNSFSKEAVVKAIRRELSRHGQVFYVFNRIEGIHKKASYLKELIPSLRVGVIHSKLKDHHLYDVIKKFKNREYDVLVSTSIIENGIDIPNATTIIFDAVETFGLAQIHQLRGRVGRSDTQSYAYLLYSEHKQLTEKAMARLQAVKEYVALGSGYDIALKDLEIRGAGSILGKEQHGHIISIGFEYYCKLLEETVAKKKGIAVPYRGLNLQTRFMTIPETYIAEPRERLACYRRLLTCQCHNDLDAIESELLDRYGRFDAQMQDVFEYIASKISEG